MLNFRPVSIDDRIEYERRLFDGRQRGCECDFGNIFLWGEQQIAYIDGQIVMFAKYGDWICYYYPLGVGDKKTAVDAIIADAKKRNIPCRINGIYGEDRALLEKLYPGRFNFVSSRNSYDYVYSIDDLADLVGKKYHGKRNHISQFRKAYPNCEVRETTAEDIEKVREMTENWYKTRSAQDPDGDYSSERRALNKALDNFPLPGFESLVLICDGKVLAFTMGSRMSADTFDVHFEKAEIDVNGAYTVINQGFARFIREKHPDILYIDREEDMGIEGLRKAKESYYPHHMIEKCRAEYIGE